MLVQASRQKVIVGITAATLLIASLSVLLMVQNGSDINNIVAKNPVGTYGKFLSQVKHPAPITLSEMYGNTVHSIDDADKSTGMKAKMPTVVPSDLALKAIKVRADQASISGMTALVYAPRQMEITDKTTLEDVLNSNGMIAVYTKDSPNFDVAKWMDAYVASAPGAHFVKINGEKAIASNGVPQNGMKSQIILDDGNVQVILFSVGYSEADLIKIAESLR